VEPRWIRRATATTRVSQKLNVELSENPPSTSLSPLSGIHRNSSENIQRFPLADEIIVVAITLFARLRRSSQ
jgi:hypothetical protein